MISCAGLCRLRTYQTCVGISRQVGGGRRDALTRVLASSQWRVSQVMRCGLQTALTLAAGTPQPCWRILDDVLLPKATRKTMRAAYGDDDDVHDNTIRCLRGVVLCWTNGVIKIPVAWALWQKQGCADLTETQTQFRTKHPVGRLFVYVVQRQGLPFDVLVCDSWSAGTEHLAWYQRRGIRCGTATKHNRVLRRLAVPLEYRPRRPRTTTDVWGTTTPAQVAAQHPYSRDDHASSAMACRTRRWELLRDGFEGFVSRVCINNANHHAGVHRDGHTGREDAAGPEHVSPHQCHRLRGGRDRDLVSPEIGRGGHVP